MNDDDTDDFDAEPITAVIPRETNAELVFGPAHAKAMSEAEHLAHFAEVPTTERPTRRMPPVVLVDGVLIEEKKP